MPCHPPAAAASANASANTNIIADRFKTRLCEKFERNGYCPYETRCMFAHTHVDLRTKEMNLREGLITEEAVKEFLAVRFFAYAASQPHSVIASRFKTKLCDHYQLNGECIFAHRCMFAHGEEDLRTTEMNLRDGLTTEEAIRALQQARLAAQRETERRRTRDDKRQQKQLQGLNPSSEHSSSVSPYAAKMSRSDDTPSSARQQFAAKPGTKSQTPEEPRSAEHSSSFDSGNCPQEELKPCRPPSMMVDGPTGAGRHFALDMSDANLQSIISITSVDGAVRGDDSPVARCRPRRHDPYAPVLIGPRAALSRSADTLNPHSAPSTPSPAMARRRAPLALLASVDLHTSRTSTPDSTHTTNGTPLPSSNTSRQ
jgi:hypothetical protein